MNPPRDKPLPLPDQKSLRSMLFYDESSGVLTWISGPRRGRKTGEIPHKDGSLRVGIAGKTYAAHRIAWKWVTGEDPIEVDHRDLCRSNNRLSNLRNASSGLNNANAPLRADNKTGFKGVCFDKARGKFLASISILGKAKSLGRFVSAQEAHNAYCVAAKQAFGEFWNPG